MESRLEFEFNGEVDVATPCPWTRLFASVNRKQEIEVGGKQEREKKRKI